MGDEQFCYTHSLDIASAYLVCRSLEGRSFKAALRSFGATVGIIAKESELGTRKNNIEQTISPMERMPTVARGAISRDCSKYTQQIIIEEGSQGFHNSKQKDTEAIVLRL